MILKFLKVKNLAMFNREVILPRAVEVTNLVIAHCNNIRSKISGAAIEALKELYRFLKKALIQNLEFSVKERFELFGDLRAIFGKIQKLVKRLSNLSSLPTNQLPCRE